MIRHAQSSLVRARSRPIPPRRLINSQPTRASLQVGLSLLSRASRHRHNVSRNLRVLKRVGDTRQLLCARLTPLDRAFSRAGLTGTTPSSARLARCRRCVESCVPMLVPHVTQHRSARPLGGVPLSLSRWSSALPSFLRAMSPTVVPGPSGHPCSALSSWRHP